MLEIKGKICGVRVTEREGYGPLLQLMLEDDGHWSLHDFIIDSFWLDDLISVLGQAKLTDMVQKGNKATIAAIKRNL